MAIPNFDQRPSHYNGRFFKGSKVVQNILLTRFPNPDASVVRVEVYNITDAQNSIDINPLDSSMVSVLKVDATHRQMVISRDKSGLLANVFGYFAVYLVDDVAVGTAKWTFGRFVPSDTDLNTATTGDDTITLSAGSNQQLVLSSPDATGTYLLTSQQIADAYNELPVQHNLNTLFLRGYGWQADGTPIDIAPVPWNAEQSTKPPTIWSDLVLNKNTSSGNRLTQILLYSPSPLL